MYAVKQFPDRLVNNCLSCVYLVIPFFAQINYLIDEGMNIGKGGNCIISLLHHFLETHNFGEAHLKLHADNCSGQNKNRLVLHIPL